MSLNGRDRIRVALVATHPIQYQAGWFRALHRRKEIELRVFFSHLPTPHEQGIGFGCDFEWDVPLLDGYEWEVLENRARHPSLTRFWGTNTRVAKRLAEWKPGAVVITGWHSYSMLQALVAARQLGIPCIVRGESNSLRRRPMHVRLLHRLLLRQFKAFLYIGRANRAFYLGYGVEEGRLFPGHYFVDHSWFEERARALGPERPEIRRAWNIADEAFCFLYAGKLEPKKRVGDFIEAGRLASNSAQIHLLVAGSGELIEHCREQALGGNVPVTFAGFLNQSEMPRAYAAADCLVLASDYGETWGLVVNEAMACGLPAMVSDQVGCGPDLIDEGMTGAVFPCGDVERLARLMAEAAGHREEWQRKGEAARKRAALYNAEAAAAGTVEAVRAVCGGNQ